MSDAVMRATHVEVNGPRNNPKNFDLSEWDQVDDTWWYRKSGDIEIHLSSDLGLSWEISQVKQGENIVNPLYTPQFDDAFAEATRLFEFHEKVRATSAPCQ
jgi:hypothetical protein